jgi:hypothetical protein
MAGTGDGEVFEAVYGHCEGADTFRVVQIWFGNEVALDVPHVQGGFEAGMFTFGDAPGQSCAPGQAVEVATPLGTLDCATSTVTPVGDQLIVQWAVRLDPVAFGGPRGIWFDAKGGAGDPEPRLGWMQVGSYDVQQAAGSTGTTGGGDEADDDTAGSTSEVTGTGAGTEADAGSETMAAENDPTGTLPGLNPDRDGSAGCGCRSHASPSPLWSLVLAAAACRRRSSRRSSRRPQPTSSSPPAQSASPSHRASSGTSLPSPHGTA